MAKDLDLGEIVVPAGLIVLVAISFFNGGSESIGSALQNGQQVKDLRQQNTLARVMSEQTAEGLSDRSDVALQRYQNCCIVHAREALVQLPEHVAVGLRTLEYQTIRENDRPIDWLTQAGYSPGSVVCDASGGTGIIREDGAITDYAYTGKDISQYVAAYFARY